MNWDSLIKGKEITVEGEKMIIKDYCKTCRKIWAESSHERYYLGIKRHSEVIYVKSKKLKPLE
mgnify:CR=1 FL=1